MLRLYGFKAKNGGYRLAAVSRDEKQEDEK
jgi:hypothetical protein